MPQAERSGLSAPAMAELLKWWHAMTGENASGTARADRAILRRAADLDAVILSPAYQRVYAELVAVHDGQPWTEQAKDRIAAIVGLAAHVKESTDQSLPEAMSRKSAPEDRNPVTELRFRRLLESPDVDALFIGLRRVLPLFKHKVNLQSLANDVFGWGDRVRKRWAYDYDWPKKARS